MNRLKRTIIEKERLGHTIQEIKKIIEQENLIVAENARINDVLLIGSNCTFKSLGDVTTYLQYGKLAIFKECEEEEIPKDWKKYNPVFIIPHTGKATCEKPNEESYLFIARSKGTRKIRHDLTNFKTAIMDIGVKNCFYPGRIDAIAEKSIHYLDPKIEAFIERIQAGVERNPRVLILTRCSKIVLRDLGARFEELTGTTVFPFFIESPVKNKIVAKVDAFFKGEQEFKEGRYEATLEKIRHTVKLCEGTRTSSQLARVLADNEQIKISIREDIQKSLNLNEKAPFNTYLSASKEALISRIKDYVCEHEVIPKGLLHKLGWSHVFSHFRQYFLTQQKKIRNTSKTKKK